MKRIKIIAAMVCLGVVVPCGAVTDPAQTWSDLVHYIRIARFDLAVAYGQLLTEGQVEPVVLFDLAAKSPQDYQLLLRARDNAYHKELADMAARLLDLIEQGRQARRSDPQVILQEIDRLLGPSARGNALALRRLQDSGEYAVPFLVEAISDPARRGYIDRLVDAMASLGGPALRPLCVATQASNDAVRVEVVRALGMIGSFEVLPYLKYMAENDRVEEIRNVAAAGIGRVQPEAMSESAASLFHRLAVRYYQQGAMAGGAQEQNMWFWDPQTEGLIRRPVDGRYFSDLMAMRACEWALRADPGYGEAVGLWVAAFVRAQSHGMPLPGFLGYGHGPVQVYATAVGPRYLLQGLARALADADRVVAVGILQALAQTAGSRSVLGPVGSIQPVLEALRSQDMAVRANAAIAIAMAGTIGPFGGAELVVEQLASAVATASDPNAPEDPNLQDQALRGLQAMLALAGRQDPAYDLSAAQDALVGVAMGGPGPLRYLACEVLGHVPSEPAQATLAAIGLDQANEADLRVAAFEALGVSARLHGRLISDQVVDQLLVLVRSEEQASGLRVAAAAAAGSMDLPSMRLKDLILPGSAD